MQTKVNSLYEYVHKNLVKKEGTSYKQYDQRKYIRLDLISV